MRTRRSTLTAASLVLALLASACGADDADDATAAAEVTADDTADDTEGDEVEGAAEEDDVDEDDASGDEVDDGADADEATADEGDDAEETPEQDQSTEAGSATVDGTDYTITEVRRCEPLDDGTIERELELQGIGEAPGGERVQIDVYVQTIGGAPFDDVSWAGPEGVFGGPDDAEVTYEDDQVTGTATVVDATTQQDTLSVAFDLPVPEELLDCR